MRMTRSGRRALRWAVAAGLCLVVAAPVAAQTTSASIFGPVKDSQGGVLPGAAGDADEPHAGQHADDDDRRRGPLRLPDRPSRPLRAQGQRAGLQDPRADQRRGERERQVLRRDHHPRGRRADGGSQRLGPRQRAADDERRALVHAGERGAQEHRQQRAPAVQLREPGAGRRPERHLRHRDPEGERLHRERTAAELQQHDDRRCRQHRHRRQRRQHGHHQHRRGRGVQAAHERLPGRVRPRGGRAAAGGHQERHPVLPRLGLLVRPALRLERQHLDEPARRRARAGRQRRGHRAREVVAQRLRLHDRRPDLHPGRLQRGQEEALLLLEPGVPEPQRPDFRAAGPRAHRPRARRGLLAERRQQRRPVPLHPRLHDRSALQLGQHQRLLRGRRRSRPDPTEPPVRSGHQRPEHLPRGELHGRQRHQLHEPDSEHRRTARGLAAAGLPGHGQVALHGPLHEYQGRCPAGLRHHLGRQRQRPAPDTLGQPASRFELPALRHRHPQRDDVARGELREGP